MIVMTWRHVTVTRVDLSRVREVERITECNESNVDDHFPKVE